MHTRTTALNAEIGATPLTKQKYDSAIALIKSTAKEADGASIINGRDAKGLTPLHHACIQFNNAIKQPDTIRQTILAANLICFLELHGADTSLTNHQARTPYDLITTITREKLLDILRKNEGEQSAQDNTDTVVEMPTTVNISTLIDAIKTTNIDSMSKANHIIALIDLIKSQAASKRVITNMMNWFDKNGQTPLHHACQHLNATKDPAEIIFTTIIIRRLVENGADPSVHDNTNLTPFDLLTTVSKDDLAHLFTRKKKKQEVTSDEMGDDDYAVSYKDIDRDRQRLVGLVNSAKDTLAHATRSQATIKDYAGALPGLITFTLIFVLGVKSIFSPNDQPSPDSFPHSPIDEPKPLSTRILWAVFEFFMLLAVASGIFLAIRYMYKGEGTADKLKALTDEYSQDFNHTLQLDTRETPTNGMEANFKNHIVELNTSAMILQKMIAEKQNPARNQVELQPVSSSATSPLVPEQTAIPHELKDDPRPELERFIRAGECFLDRLNKQADPATPISSLSFAAEFNSRPGLR